MDNLKKKKCFSFSDRLCSFRYAFVGIKTLFTEQHNAWIHLFALICVCIAGVLLNISTIEWLVCLLCFGMILAAEAFNSAIETLANRVCMETDAMIGKAKDLAAAGVLLAAMGAAGVGIVIFIPKIWNLLCD